MNTAKADIYSILFDNSSCFLILFMMSKKCTYMHNENF